MARSPKLSVARRSVSEAKAELRAAAAPIHTGGPLGMVTRNPLATAAVVLGVVTIVGPRRTLRLGMSAITGGLALVKAHNLVRDLTI